MRWSLVASVAGLTLLAALTCSASAQEAEPAAEAPAEAAPPPRQPKPKPRPKPQAKPTETPTETKAPGQESPASPPGGAAAGPPPGTPAVAPVSPPSPAQTLAAAPPVACEPGEAVRYEAAARPGQGAAGTGGLELWVTRTGTITLDNPLRPLTPDVTRVLQVVIGGKVATAYGPDLLSLRRGAGPAVLEGVIGGAIRWNGALGALPDVLPILSDSGDVLAEFAFRACGKAPAARTLAAPRPRRTAPPPEAAAPDAATAAGQERSRPARRVVEPRPEGAPPRPPAVPLPQGAIP